jgi:pimeloyl-ACP methyl ester carboxylesterase
MNRIRTDLLEIAFETGGPADGPPVLLLHGWPDDVRGWRGVTPALEAAGLRWIAPWVRGCGPTCFLDQKAVRDGRAVALAQDVLDLADQLGLERFGVVGHDWGARTAYTLAALAPERLNAMVTLALGYAPHGAFPTLTFSQSRNWWYQWFMSCDRGARAVAEDPRGFARIQWSTWSPPGWYDEDEFARTAESFDNPDWVAVTLHAYRSRWLPEVCDPRYDDLQARLKATGTLSTPTLMIQGAADACDPPSESEGQAEYFTGGWRRLLLDGVGHFPAREAPEAVADAVLEHFGL